MSKNTKKLLVYQYSKLLNNSFDVASNENIIIANETNIFVYNIMSRKDDTMDKTNSIMGRTDNIFEYKRKVFIPKLGFICYKIKKEKGRIIRSATYIKPSKLDIVDAKKYNLPLDFVSYLNFELIDCGKKFDSDEDQNVYENTPNIHFENYIKHVDIKNVNIIGIMSYIHDRNCKFISYIFLYIWNITYLDIRINFLNQMLKYYPPKEYSDEYSNTIEFEIEYLSECIKEPYGRNISDFSSKIDKLNIFKLFIFKENVDSQKLKICNENGNMHASGYAQKSWIPTLPSFGERDEE